MQTGSSYLWRKENIHGSRISAEVETLGCLNEDSLVHVCIPAGNARSWEISSVDGGSESLSPLLCPCTVFQGRHTHVLEDGPLTIYELYILNLFANPWWLGILFAWDEDRLGPPTKEAKWPLCAPSFTSAPESQMSPFYRSEKVHPN